MFYCADFISLPILSLYEGEMLGKVDKLYFDKRLKKLVKMEILGEDGAKWELLSKNIYRVGKNAITIKNNSFVKLLGDVGDLSLAPVGSKAYSISGEFLGVVQEISFDEKFNAKKISLNNSQLMDVEDVALCGKNTLIFYNQTSPRTSIKKFNPKKEPKIFKSNEEIIVSIQPAENKENELKNQQPKAIVQNPNFLVGRVCTKDIYNFNNELLIKERSVVNKKNLKEISKFGKLRELMLYIK